MPRFGVVGFDALVFVDDDEQVFFGFVVVAFVDEHFCDVDIRARHIGAHIDSFVVGVFCVFVVAEFLFEQSDVVPGFGEVVFFFCRFFECIDGGLWVCLGLFDGLFEERDGAFFDDGAFSVGVDGFGCTCGGFDGVGARGGRTTRTARRRSANGKGSESDRGESAHKAIKHKYISSIAIEISARKGAMPVVGHG